MALELNNSWKYKYEKLERENQRLEQALNFIVKQNKPQINGDDSSDSKDNEEEIVSPVSVSSIPIANIAESLEFDENPLIMLTGGNIEQITSPRHHVSQNMMNGHTNNNNNKSISKHTKPNIKKQAYVD